MADIQVNVMREISTKEIVMWSLNALTPNDGCEVLSVYIPEDDYSSGIYTRKYRFNATTGELEINGKFFIFLEVDDQALMHSPEGIPQVYAGSGDTFNVILRKKDLQGNYYTSVIDNDTIYVSVSGGTALVSSFELSYGVATVTVKAGNVYGMTTVKLTSSDIMTSEFCYQNI